MKNSVINFMYFASSKINENHILKICELLGNKQHFFSKFNSISKDNLTDKLFTFFYQLSEDNQIKLIDYIDNLYHKKTDVSKTVKFEILELLDPVKQGSDLEIGAIRTGKLVNNKIHYTASNDIEWVFYPGQTAKILK